MPTQSALGASPPGPAADRRPRELRPGPADRARYRTRRRAAERELPPRPVRARHHCQRGRSPGPPAMHARPGYRRHRVPAQRPWPPPHRPGPQR